MAGPNRRQVWKFVLVVYYRAVSLTLPSLVVLTLGRPVFFHQDPWVLTWEAVEHLSSPSVFSQQCLSQA